MSNGINFLASLHNLLQMGRHQDNAHRAPVVNQDQNAQLQNEEATRRSTEAAEAEESEGKNINPDDRRREEQRRRKREKKHEEEKRARDARGDSGRFVDLDA